MNDINKRVLRIFGLIALLAVSSISVIAQQSPRSPFDVTNYRMDVQLSPNENKLTATVDVDFTPLADTRSVDFELNGSLRVDSVTRENYIPPANTDTAPTPTPDTKSKAKPTPTPQILATFVQDQVGISDLGPSIRVDLGEMVTKGTPVTLRFKYSGILVTPSGGPLLTKRLAYVGANNGYLMYAARWFPFHEYAADQATSDITISIPPNFQLVGFSDQPVTQTAGKYRFIRTKSGLVGNFAYDQYTNRNMRSGEYELQFYSRPAEDAKIIAEYGETLAAALNYYDKQFGLPEGGRRLIVVQIDDDSLDFYSTQGMIFMASNFFRQPRDVTAARLQREAAYQWWGLTVGLKSFDDAWLSQGLAEYSAFSLRESQMTGAKLDLLRREFLEKSLTFEQTASLGRTPANLDDQSVAYQYIMFGKGAFVFKLLRDTLGEQKFNKLLRNYLSEFRGKNASIFDFEKLASVAAGKNLRYFFARWVDGTGVPEFSADYQIIRTREGKFITRGTVKQNYDDLRLPLELQLRAEGDGEPQTVVVQMDSASADFNIESNGKPLELLIDPNFKLLRIDDELRVSSIARRGIEQFKEGNYVEAQQQFEAALKLDRSNSWIYYHLGLLFLEQRNYDLAIDNFKAVLTGNLRPQWLAVWANIKMGNAYDSKGDRTRAVSAYDRAEALGDDYDGAQNAVKKYKATPFDPREKEDNSTAVN